jgi:hypothetical protein
MVALILVMLFTLLTTPLHAQEATADPALFEQYKTDYLFQRDLYQKSLLNYSEKQQVDEQYGTVATQNDKFNALKETLINRNKMLRAYIMALRVHLNSNKAINNEDTNKIQTELSNWEQWFDQQNQTINSYGSIDNIKSWTTDFKAKYVDIQKSIYTALVQNEVNLDLQALSEINNVTAEAQTLPNITDREKVLIDDIKSKPETIITYLKNAIGFTQKQQINPNRFNDFYPEAKVELNHAREYLSEMAANIKLVITRVTD